MNAVTIVGLALVGPGFTANETVGEVCPPLETVIEAVPADAIRFALTWAVS
jgi:hypothetical protein